MTNLRFWNTLFAKSVPTGQNLGRRQRLQTHGALNAWAESIDGMRQFHPLRWLKYASDVQRTLADAGTERLKYHLIFNQSIDQSINQSISIDQSSRPSASCRTYGVVKSNHHLECLAVCSASRLSLAEPMITYWQLHTYRNKRQWNFNQTSNIYAIKVIFSHYNEYNFLDCEHVVDWSLFVF